MIDMQKARQIIGQMSPLPWLVLESKNGEMTIIRNPIHPIHIDGLDAWRRREDAERPDAAGIAYMRAEFPAALDEIARLREALIEERAMKLMTEHNDASSPIKDMVDFLCEARQQLGAERKI